MVLIPICINFLYNLNTHLLILKYLSLSTNSQITYQYFGWFCEVLSIIFKIYCIVELILCGSNSLIFQNLHFLVYCFFNFYVMTLLILKNIFPIVYFYFLFWIFMEKSGDRMVIAHLKNKQINKRKPKKQTKHTSFSKQPPICFH